jgi:hypothetical protein
MFQSTRDYLKKLGLPQGDLFDMPSSAARFPDGAAYRIEIPTVNSAEAIAALLDRATKNGVTINRVTETYGMFRHTRQEIKECCKLCADYGAELVMSVGPRAPTTPARRFSPRRECASATGCAAWSRSSAPSKTSSAATTWAFEDS